MLLLHQVGSVKIGEVVRYTVTYTPSHDRILPSPEYLHLRIRNTSAIALRAAFVHGPYTLSVAAYPSHFNPNEKFAEPRRYGVPEFEPMLKAGGTWNCHLVVPDNIRQSAGTGRQGYFGAGPGHDGESVSWVVEVASQVIFSTSAAVNYEVLLARDEKSLNLGSGIPVIGGQAQLPLPGRVSDYQHSLAANDHAHPSKGVFSRAVHLRVEDTAGLWNTPRLPAWEDSACADCRRHAGGGGQDQLPVASDAKLKEVEGGRPPAKLKRIHLVVLTHGLHGNLGSDMLYLKESIDAGVRQAKKDAKARRARERAARSRRGRAREGGLDSRDREGPGPASGGDDGYEGGGDGDGDGGDGDGDGDGDESEDDEDVIVRGFSGNATRTERGIKYLGKRLARFVLSMTYPDQPYAPAGKVASETAAHALRAAAPKHDEGPPSHKHSTVHMTAFEGQRMYKITKISFVAHSLGGLVQTYAVAYIQKHSPRFFDLIEPVNFIAMATPFLGLNHENPMYVKFALDFGLVGRTGQDLGLTWRAPTIARNGWGALVSNLGENAHKHVYGEVQPESKPLLRILPTGPAHIALKKFRNRTLYSNVVNDGIVPLRTSCLLFLDWQGLGRVEKARREAGLVETVVRSGWAELTGANVTAPRNGPWVPEADVEDGGQTAEEPAQESSHDVPQPPKNATLDDDRESLRATRKTSAEPEPEPEPEPSPSSGLEYSSTTNNSNPFSGLLNLFRSNNGNETQKPSPAPAPGQRAPGPKQNKIYQRSQTLRFDDPASKGPPSPSATSGATTGPEPPEGFDGVSAPPTTTFFESAGDLLNPKLPSVEYLIDPSKRPRAIFHDRVYHPSDIPPPPLKKRPTGSFGLRAKPPAAPPSRADASGSSSPRSAASSSAAATPPRRDSSASRRDHDEAEQQQHRHHAADPGAGAGAGDGDDGEAVVDGAQMRVEEKIARAYHRGLSWRKVLVKLEPDAHNNMVVRRTFANAFGWPVVRHLVDAHFADSAVARTPDRLASSRDRAADDADDAREALDTLSDLPRNGNNSSNPAPSPGGAGRPRYDRVDSAAWSDRDWADSGAESEGEGGGEGESPRPAGAGGGGDDAAEPSGVGRASVEGRAEGETTPLSPRG